MAKMLFGTIAVCAVVAVFIGIGVVIGGGWGASEAADDHTRLVNSCIESNGGSMTKAQFAACIDQARQGSQ